MKTRELSVLTKTRTFSLIEATIIHVNHYYESEILRTLPVWHRFSFGTLRHTELVFRLTDGREVFLHTINHRLPVYKGKKVEVIMADNKVLGFHDPQIEEYYITSDSIVSDLKLMYPKYISFLILMGLYVLMALNFIWGNSVVDSYITENQWAFWSMIVFFVGSWIVRILLEKYLEHQIDGLINDEDSY